MVGRNITRVMSILAVGLMAASTSAFAGGDRFECKASGAGDTSMDGKFEDKDKGREKFSASFESLNGAIGDVFQVTVDGEMVGNITLAAQPDGNLGGDLDFDNNIDRDEPDTTVPFPANWPGAGRGTIVMVGTLGCTLQAR